MQSDVTVTGNKIAGTLTKLTGHNAITDVWGEGWFVALKFSDFASGLTYNDVKVGLVPSQGSGFVTLDSDCNGIFKVNENDPAQKFMVVQEKGGKRLTQVFTFDFTLE